MTKKEQTRNRVKRYRERQNSVTSGSVTSPSVTQETVPASFVYGINRKYLSLPKRERLLILKDKQVLDRTNLPESKHDFGDSMRQCNESCYGYKPLRKH